MPPFNLDVLFICAFCIPGIMTKYTPHLNPEFFFDINKSGETSPIPVTGRDKIFGRVDQYNLIALVEQCDSIRITWGRSTASSVPPEPPFYAQVIASTLTAPILIPVGNGPTFDWNVPFAPGTQYQICMYDRHGVSGGCQEMYTVIRRSTTLHPTCQNITASASLSVVATKPSEHRPQYGFIKQCTDMTITPTSGTPPFVLTVTPSLHPPFNITSNSMSPITWAVSLSWGSSFFVTLSSSDGKMWSMGPMHAGWSGTSDCLAPEVMSQRKITNIAIGISIGSTVGGICLGLLWAYLAIRYRRHRFPTLVISDTIFSPGSADTEMTNALPLLPSSPPVSSRPSHRLGFSGGSRSEDVAVEPFTAEHSPGFIAEGTKGRWQGLEFTTIDSSQRNPQPRLHVATHPPWVPTIPEEPRYSTVSYPAIPNSESFAEPPPEYMLDPADNIS